MYVNTPDELCRWKSRVERLWNEGIPLARAMGARIESLDDSGLVATAPLSANLNHMGIAFGGGLQTLATLAGWALTLIAAGEARPCRVVIRESRMRFLAPVTGDLRARARWPDPERLEAFRAQLDARGRARLAVDVRYGEADAPQALFEGDFVARLGEKTDVA